jgi:hypothetical protein
MTRNLCDGRPREASTPRTPLGAAWPECYPTSEMGLGRVKTRWREEPIE